MSVNKEALCEDCFYFDYLYDDEEGEMGCTVGMDEDEMLRVLSHGKRVCPYYREHDEYKIVRKQN